MPAPPPFHIHIERFAVWRAAICALASVAAVVIAAWFASAHQAASNVSALEVACGSALGALAVLASLGAASVSSFALKWREQSWSLARVPGAPVGHGDALVAGKHAGPHAEPMPGSVSVALDVGSFVLLRFTPGPTASSEHGAARPCWLPMQRRGHEPAWHALRCALYAKSSASLSLGGHP